MQVRVVLYYIDFQYSLEDSDTVIASPHSATIPGNPANDHQTTYESCSMDASAVSAKRRLVEKIMKERGTLEGNRIDSEINNYLTYKPTSSESDDAMLFWRMHANKFPTLQRLARYYLSISASSVPAESMFSITGLILNSRRSSLSPSKLNVCTFIHDNVGGKCCSQPPAASP